MSDQCMSTSYHSLLTDNALSRVLNGFRLHASTAAWTLEDDRVIILVMPSSESLGAKYIWALWVILTGAQEVLELGQT